MIDVIGPAFPGTNAAILIAIDLALKAAILLAMGFAVHAMLGRGRTLARSALWDAILIGLLLLPLASLVFPRLRLAVLPAAMTASTVQLVDLPENSIFAHQPVQMAPVAIARAAPTPTPQASAAVASPHRAPERPVGIAGLLVVIYMTGAVFLAIRLVGSLGAVRGLKRRCAPVVDLAWLAALERTRVTLNISRPVALLESDRVSVPMVVGCLPPVIVVPLGLAQTAGAELIDMALLHELAHVRRGDFAWNLVHKLVRLFYWPHPLIWPVGRMISTVREQACDDLCVHGMGSAAAYRASLLQVASGLVRRPELSLGLALARELNLAARLARIDASRGKSRCLESLPGRFGMAMAVMVLTALVGSIDVQRQAVSAEQRKDGDATKTERQVQPPPAIEIVVRAKDTGKRLPDATVRFSIDFGKVIRTADRDGVLRFDLSQRTFQDRLSFDVWAEGYVQQRFFFAQNDTRYPKIPSQFGVELLPGEETLGGTVTDARGHPIRDVEVIIWGYLGSKKAENELAWMVSTTTNEKGEWRSRSFRGMKFAYLFLSHPDYLADGRDHPRQHGQPRQGDPPPADNQAMARLRDFSDVQVMTVGVSLAGKITDEQDQPIAGALVGWLHGDVRIASSEDTRVATTKADGRFRFPHVRPGSLAIQVKAKGHAPELKPLDEIDMAGHLTVKLGPARTLSGRVVDSGGKPIPDVFVNVDTWRGYRSLGVFLKTDAEGRFRWDDAPSDAVLINASLTGFAGIFQRTVSPDEKEITLILKRSLTISGKVRDPATEKPIDPILVEVGVPDPESGEIIWANERTAFAALGRLQGEIDVENRPEIRLRISVEGYEPFVSRAFRREENQVEYNVNLTKSDRPEGIVINGQVRRPNGGPLEGALVTVTYPTSNQSSLPALHILNGGVDPIQPMRMTKTDAAGRFSLDRKPVPAGKYFAIVVIHSDFYAEVDRSVFEMNPTITAKPWGRVEGVALDRGKPAAGASIRYFADRLGNADVPSVFDQGDAKADGDGRFVLERVVPGDTRVTRGARDRSNLEAWFTGELLVAKSGDTAHIEVGKLRGRPVIAKIIAPPEFDPKADYARYSEFEVVSDRPMIPPRTEMKTKKGQMKAASVKDWWASPEGHEYRRAWHRHGQVKLQADGSIRLDDVPPGDYRLKLSFSAERVRGPGASPERVAHATMQFTIPEIPGGHSEDPFDLGVLRPTLVRKP